MENKPMISETEKREALKHFMAEKAKAPVCVAFSGGVDSSLILKLACDTAKKTGMPVYAVTFHTMLHPACDLEIAERVAKELGAIHKIIQVNGEPITSASHLINYVALQAPNSTIKVEVVRDEQPLTLNVVVTERKAQNNNSQYIPLPQQ